MRRRYTLMGLGLAAVVVLGAAATGLSCKMDRGAHATAAAAPSAASATARFAVANVTCGHCEKKISGAVASLAGVRACSYDAATHAVTVTYEPGRTTPAAIGSTISHAGYPASLITIADVKGTADCPVSAQCPYKDAAACKAHMKEAGMAACPHGDPAACKAHMEKAGTSAASSMDACPHGASGAMSGAAMGHDACASGMAGASQAGASCPGGHKPASTQAAPAPSTAKPAGSI